ncbi:hypothetical protein PM082_002228 [Marasmius tenuissimus]|nr:hypothetical protein PM082_002228 [Marasmius tenuissimus]
MNRFSTSASPFVDSMTTRISYGGYCPNQNNFEDPQTPISIPTSISNNDDTTYTNVFDDFSFLNSTSPCDCDHDFLYNDSTTPYQHERQILWDWTGPNAFSDPTVARSQRIPIYSSDPGPSFLTSTERRRPTSKFPIRPLFTYEPLENVLRSSLPNTVAPLMPRRSSARPWHWLDVSIVENWLGTSLSGVSTPNFEQKGFLYCYRIEGGSPFWDSEWYKVGRTVDYVKREDQWRRQCHSQTQTWFPPVPVAHCHQTGQYGGMVSTTLLIAYLERLVHLKLDQMCLSRPRKQCNDCLKKHCEIFEMLEVFGRDVWEDIIVPLILEIDSLLDRAGWIEKA